MKHRLYTGEFFTKHLFVEIKKGIFDEWDLNKINNISRKDIAKWLIHEKNSQNKTMLLKMPYIKQGCKNIELVKTI